MSRSVIVTSLALAASACAPKPEPSPPRVQHEHVAKHFVVVVQEPDPLAPDESRAASLLTRSVAAGPLLLGNERESAFATHDPRYSVLVAWRRSGECLDVTVGRHGLLPFDDFAAHGCVKLDGPTKTVATVNGASGAPIEVQVWILET